MMMMMMMVDLGERKHSLSSITYLFDDFCRMKSKNNGQNYRSILQKIAQFHSFCLFFESDSLINIFISNRTAQHQNVFSTAIISFCFLFLCVCVSCFTFKWRSMFGIAFYLIYFFLEYFFVLVVLLMMMMMIMMFVAIILNIRWRIYVKGVS